MAELSFPTEFTLEQLQRMRELVARENTVTPNQSDHNLNVKLTNYVWNAHAIPHRARATG